MVARAGAGKEGTDHSTDVVYGEDNTGRWQPMPNLIILNTPELSTDILFPRLAPLVKRSVYARIPLIPILKERVAVHEGGYKDKTSNYARLTWQRYPIRY